MGIFYDVSRAETFHARTHGYSQKTILCGKLTQTRCTHSLPSEFEKKIGFYVPCFVCFHIPKKLKSSVLFLAGLPHPRAGRASCTLFRNENANTHTCTDNL